MSQVLLDGTAESVSVSERLRFLRKLEDNQAPVVFIDRQGVKHLVHISKVTLVHQATRQMDGDEELNVQVTCVDASDGRWPQPKLALSLSLSYSAVLG